MDLVIVKKGESGDDEHRENLVNYIEDDRKLMIGGNGVDYTNAGATLKQMETVAEYFDKTHVCPLVQVILAFDGSVTDPQMACAYTKQAAQYFGEDYQSVYCAHEKDHECATLHAHIMLNPVNVQDGKLLDTNHDNMDAFCDYVSDITGNNNRLIYKRKPRKNN